MEMVGLVPKTFLPECVRLAYYQALDTEATGTHHLPTHPLPLMFPRSTVYLTDGMPTDPDEAAVVTTYY